MRCSRARPASVRRPGAATTRLSLSTIISTAGFCGAAHEGQSRRTSRCADDAVIDVATRKGSTPMSIRRVSADGRVVGVQRAEHQVAGQRGLDGDLGRLRVADLADQDRRPGPDAGSSAGPWRRSARPSR